MTVALTPAPGRESPPFHGSRDVSLPFGLYNFPRRTLGKRGSTSREEGKEDNWLSFYWRFWLFPPSGWRFHKLGIDIPRGASERLPAQTAAFLLCVLPACCLTERSEKHLRSKIFPPLPLPDANAGRKIEQKEWEQREKWVLGYP